MPKKRKMSGIVLLQQDVERFIVKPMIRSIKVETARLQKKAVEILAEVRGQAKEIEIVARELKRQADQKE